MTQRGTNEIVTHLALSETEKVRERRMKQSRSKITNGVRLFLEGRVDERLSTARRLRDIINSIERDLGGDLTEAQRQLTRRAAILSLAAEHLESQLVNGDAVNLDELGRLSSHSRRLFETLGVERRAKNVVTLDDVIAGHAERRTTRGGGK